MDAGNLVVARNLPARTGECALHRMAGDSKAMDRRFAAGLGDLQGRGDIVFGCAFVEIFVATEDAAGRCFSAIRSQMT